MGYSARDGTNGRFSVLLLSHYSVVRCLPRAEVTRVCRGLRENPESLIGGKLSLRPPLPMASSSHCSFLRSRLLCHVFLARTTSNRLHPLSTSYTIPRDGCTAFLSVLLLTLLLPGIIKSILSVPLATPSTRRGGLRAGELVNTRFKHPACLP